MNPLKSDYPTMKSSVYCLFAIAISCGLSSAATIVNTTTTAIFDVTGGNDNSNIVTVTDPNDANGLTMNVTFTPNAGDIAQSTNAIPLVEIGGNANGSGLYLLGGQVYFLSKMNGANTDVITTFPDLDQTAANDMIGVRTSNITGIPNGGVLTAGTEYSVAAILDPTIGSASVTLAIQPTGGSLSSMSWAFTNDGTNWAGNNTVVSFNPPSNAGAGNTVGGDPFQEGTGIMNALGGTAGQALIFNEVATLIPEPAGFSLVGLGGLLLFLRRRR